MEKNREANPPEKLVGKRVGAQTGSKAIVIIAERPGTAPGGAQKEKVDRAAK